MIQEHTLYLRAREDNVLFEPRYDKWTPELLSEGTNLTFHMRTRILTMTSDTEQHIQEPVRLTPSEAVCFEALHASYPHHVSDETVLRQFYQRDLGDQRFFCAPDTHEGRHRIHRYMGILRAKLRAWGITIQRVYGVGYVFQRALEPSERRSMFHTASPPPPPPHPRS